VVAPKEMGGLEAKRQKTDQRDSGQLCDALDRYLRGQDKALSVVAVPTLEQEQNRALIRYHRQMIQDRTRAEARGKGLLSAQTEEKPLRERIEALAPERLPKGVGAYSAAVLKYEMKAGSASAIAGKWLATRACVRGFISVMVGAKKARSTAVATRRSGGRWSRWSGD
jgi:transposase